MSQTLDLLMTSLPIGTSVPLVFCRCGFQIENLLSEIRLLPNSVTYLSLLTLSSTKSIHYVDTQPCTGNGKAMPTTCSGL